MIRAHRQQQSQEQRAFHRLETSSHAAPAPEAVTALASKWQIGANRLPITADTRYERGARRILASLLIRGQRAGSREAPAVRCGTSILVPCREPKSQAKLRGYC